MAAYENWRVEWAPTSQPDDPFPVWEDLTPWVDTVGPEGSPWTAQAGRPTEFDTSQPGNLSMRLNNSDHRFTPGNASSPLYPNFKLARRLRIRETIGYRTFNIFSGWLELPDISDWAEAGVDQVITVSAVDRLARLDRGRKFISTLTEYVLYNGTGLQAYYPLLESAGTIFYDKSTYGREPTHLFTERNASVTPTQGGPPFTAGNGRVLPGDDLAGPTWSPRLDAASLAAEATYPRGTWASGFTQSGTDTVTVAAWVTLAVDPPTGGRFASAFRLYSPNGILGLDSSPWQFFGRTGIAQATVNCPGPPAGIPILIAVRLNLSTASVELWRHNDPPLTGTLSGGTVPSSVVWNEVEAGGAAYSGTVTHGQVYMGDSSVYTRAMHLAQIQAGTVGLAGQTTGQRIRTMAAYAGIPAGQLNVDDGVTRMQNTSLAGKSPLTPMREAETAEQGLLLADGAGELVFQDRIHRINI